MGLKNYTSSVPASTSITWIEKKLASKGATQILKEYGPDARVSCIKFSLRVDGQDVLFNLPAQIENCERVLRANLSQRAKADTIKKVPAQAERTAWKILADWVDAQMARIELAQVEVMEVFLPYVFDAQHNRTFFQLLKEKNFKMLPGA